MFRRPIPDVQFNRHLVRTLGAKLGHILVQIQYLGTTSLDMSQNSKHDLGQVLGLILGSKKCLMHCTSGGQADCRSEDEAVADISKIKTIASF